MNRLNTYLATLFTPPAVILNVYSLVIDNVNVLLLIGVSIVSIVFWCVAIRAKQAEKLKNQAQAAAFKAQQEYYEKCTRADCGLKNQKFEK
jgi:hypothetical protein